MSTRPDDVDDDQDRNWKAAQASLKEKDEQLSAKDSRIRELTFAQAGFPIDKGQGKAVAAVMGNVSVDELTIESIRQVAKDEFGFEPADATATVQPPSTQSRVDQRLDQMGASTQPPPAPGDPEEFARKRDEALNRAIDLGQQNEQAILESMSQEIGRAVAINLR